MLTRLNASSDPAHWVHVCSAASSIEHTRKIARRTLPSHFISPVNTRAMYQPAGLVNAAITSRKKRISRTPLAPMLELLRPQQGVKQIYRQRRGHHQCNYVFRGHSFSHPRTNAQLTANNSSVSNTKAKSNMRLPHFTCSSITRCPSAASIFASRSSEVRHRRSEEQTSELQSHS